MSAQAALALEWKDDVTEADLAKYGIEGLGACREVDPETMYPEGRAEAKASKEVCAGCPQLVRAACLKQALDNDERFGTWGGKTEWERKALRQRTRMAAYREGLKTAS